MEVKAVHKTDTVIFYFLRFLPPYGLFFRLFYCINGDSARHLADSFFSGDNLSQFKERGILIVVAIKPVSYTHLCGSFRLSKSNDRFRVTLRNYSKWMVKSTCK